MSNRTTPQEGEKSPESRGTPDFSKFMVCDSFSNPISSPAAAGEEPRRLSRQQLEEAATRLSDRDRVILTAAQRYRYLLTGQIQRLYFADAATPSAALRAASRTLKKLLAMGLIGHLDRRIGGVRAGSGGFVWHLTHAGERLLRLRKQSASPMRPYTEPSPYFLAHTLAVADIAIQLTELCREQFGVKLTALQPEPECWRSYSEYGTITALKPDLFAVTVSGQYEDRWFIEVDLDTESPAKITAKSEKYHKYYRTGLEQEETGVFPLTVWIVPSRERKEKLTAYIREAFNKQPKLFAVITQDELRGLICQGGEGGSLC
nr:replication-relaxation family protein [uncultured Oscillibacter sp.]